MSTKDKGQDTENQLQPAPRVYRAAWQYYKVFTYQESVGKTDRTEFKQFLLEAYQQKFDLVVF